MERPALVLLAGLLSVLPQGRSTLPTVSQDVAASVDVKWLERMSADVSFAESEFAARGRRIGSVKRLRSDAYLRLGAIGSRESRDAIARIEKTAFERSVLPGPGVPRRMTYHPAPHMSDFLLSPVAQARLNDGREAAAFALDWYGLPMLFVALRQAGTWTPPYLIPMPMNPFGQPDVTMTEVTDGRLRFALTAPQRQGFGARFEPTPDAFEVRIAEVTRDTDGDGWSDLAERHLGTNWNEADSDRDGIADGRDDAPLYSGLTAPNGEDEHILQRAVFAMFGLTESPGELHVADASRRFHPFGLPGPLFYGERQGGVRVTWRILDKTADTATVEITDYEGALAASGNDVTLKKIDGAWYATAIRMRWIS